VADTCIGVISFYVVGFGLANEANGGLLGTKYFAGRHFTNREFLMFIFQFALGSNCSTIVSGCLAERTFVDTYIVFSVFITGFIYPIAISWSWGQGWLYELGYLDFAGSGNIHMLGGLCGLIGTILLGPRLGHYGK
jgi:Amt family ammonium transporter